jgi:hypothetical protein
MRRSLTPGVAEFGWSHGARCDSGGAIRFRRAADGGLRVELSTYTQCGDSRRDVQAPVDLGVVARVPARDPLARLRGDPVVRAGAVESLARRQSEAAVCGSLAGLPVSTPEDLAVVGRMLELAHDRCLLDAALAAASGWLQEQAAYAIIRMTDEPGRREALLHVVRRGGGAWSAELIASSLNPAGTAALVAALRTSLLAPNPAERAGALAALGKLVDPAERPDFFLSAALALRRCADRVALLESLQLSIAIGALTGPRLVDALAPLMRDRGCPAARAATVQRLAARLASGGPVTNEQGNEAAWALLARVLPASSRENLCENLRYANPSDRAFAPSLRR